MNTKPQSGSRAGRTTAASEAGPAQAVPASVVSGPADILTVGLFIPKRLAWRLVQLVDALTFERLHELADDDGDARVWQDVVIEVKKALQRAGYAGPA